MASINKKKIEMSSINILEHVLLDSDIIFSDIAANDKTPSFDGTLTLYKKEYTEDGYINDSKENIEGIINIQLKGKYTKDVAQLDEKSISYPVDISDLKNYRRKGGAIFFVVLFKDGDTYTVYYNSLLPLDLEDLLRKIRDGQAKKSIKLTKFPSDVVAIERIIQNYNKDSSLQHSTAISGYWEIDDLKTIPNVIFRQEDLLHKISTKELFNTPFYLYKPLEGKIVRPLARVFIEEILIEKQFPVKLDGKVYYDLIQGGRDNKNYRIKIGNSFDIYILIADESEITFNWELSGTLDQRLNDSKFFLDLLKCNELEIEHLLKGKIDVSEISQETMQVVHEFYLALKTLFDKLKITKELDFTKLTEEDFNNISVLKRAIVEGEELDIFNVPFNIAISSKKIGNIDLKFILEKTDTDKYQVYNFFDDRYKNQKVTYRENDKDILEVPLCTLLKKSDFLNFDNIDYEFIYDGICNIDSLTDDVNNYLTMYILDMLLAYDERNDQNLLMCIIKITGWLVKKDPKSIVSYINYLQAVYRQRALSNEESQQLVELKFSKDQDTEILIAINILLKQGGQENKFLFQKLLPEQKENFRKYPIINLLPDKDFINDKSE